jgi:hypothetical protein
VTWHEIYQTDAQGLWAVIVVPVLFLVWRATRGAPQAPGSEARAARFVDVWSIVFGLEIVLDALVGTLLLRWLGGTDTPLGQAIVILCIWIGDFRVFFLMLGVADPTRPGRAAAEAIAWSAVIPAFAFTVLWLLHAALGELPGVVLWIVYEGAFAVLALALGRWLVPARVAPARPGVRRYLRAVLAWSATYYALWSASDVLVLSGIDAGWALRIVPNQLYYSFFVAFAALAFARYVSTSASAQAAR